MKKEEMMLKATQMLAKGKFKLKKASPTIMIVGAAIGGVTAAVLACKAMIKDSGDRTEFETGAKRDMHAGKGRMDLLPWYGIMEVSKHCEEGALKYGEHNVDKGIPLHSLLDSASRHLAKYMVGMDDEDHLRAACWNLLWALNQRVTHPELDDRFTVKEKKAAKMVLTKCANCGKEWPVSEDDWVRMCAWSFSLKRDSAITRCPDCREVARIYKVGEVSTDE